MKTLIFLNTSSKLGNYTSTSNQEDTNKESIDNFNKKNEELEKRINKLERTSIPVVVSGLKGEKEDKGDP